MTRWLLMEVGEDEYDVLRNGRPVQVGRTWEQARKYVGLHKSRSDRAQIVEQDGYRRPARIR